MSELLALIQKVLDDKQGMNIVSIDMSSACPFTDYFVLVTAKNLRHAQSLAEQLTQEIEKNGYSIRGREGDQNSSWVLLDAYDVIVHIFTQETREIYRLEALWSDQPQMTYPD